MISSVLALAASLGLSQPESPGALFERGYFLEQAKGDLEAAIELYERVVEEFPDERGVAARALLRIGLCHERLGYEAAAHAYRRLLESYADQEEAARIARERLFLLRSRSAGSRVDLPSGATLREIVLPDGRSIRDTSASLSYDGRRLAYVDAQLESLVVYDLALQKAVASTAARRGNFAYRWTRDGRFLAFDEMTEDSNRVQVFDTHSGHVSQVYEQKNHWAWPVDWTPDGRRLLVLVSEPEGVRLMLLDREGRVHHDVPALGRGHRLSPSGRWIAFAEWEDEGDIRIAPLLEGKALDEAMRVAPYSSQDRNPVWSPDGRFLAFASNRAKSWDLWIIEMEEGRAAGEPILVHKDLGEEAHLQDWLPDGKLTFSKRRPLGDVWIQPVDPSTGEATGTASLLPTAVRGWNGQPRWSPDGRRIAFRSQRERPGGTLFIADLVDGTETAIDLPEGHQNADWYPDGQRIVYSAFLDGALVLAEVNLSSKESRTISSVPPFESSVPAPDVSPDGEKILFNRYSRETGKVAHFYHDEELGEMREIPNTEGSWRARWSPDGRWIAFTLDERFLCVVGIDGSGKRCLVELTEPDFLNPWIAWSPDGQWIVYPRGSYTADRLEWDLRLVSFDGVIHRSVGELAALNPWWVDWSPDGHKLALASADGTVEFWVMENFFRPEPLSP